MPRVTINQTNFTAGEISPKCYGRVDVARYQNGAAAMPNCVVNLHGGAERRPGSAFIAPTKDSAKRARLVPYIFSTTQAYMLEFGHMYIRVYAQSGGQVLSGGAPYEIATPYTEDMLSALDYTQGADTMFIFHPAVPIHILQRIASDFWSIKPAPITVAPFDEVGHIFPTGLTLSDATPGAGRTATAPADAFIFLQADVGRRLTFQSGVALVTAYNSANSVTVEIQNAFPGTVLPANAWELLDSPQATITPSAKDPVGAGCTLSTAVQMTTPEGEPPSYAGVETWRPEDVGKFVRINGGMVQIVGYQDSYTVDTTIKEELTSEVASPANAWTLEGSVWSGQNGYPSTGALFEQRLAVAGSPKYPQTVWGSRSGLFYDFTIGTNGDDAFSFSLPSTGQINPIQRMVTAKALMPLTYGGEYTMEGGGDEPLTPTSVKARSPSVYGCNQVKPLRIGNEVLFVQRAGRKVRSLAYRIESDTYNAPDLTVLAEHVTASGIVDMAYQQEPGSRLWCVRADGKLATLTLDRDEGVVAWTPQHTDGLYESCASIPNAEGDEMWVIVQRTVNGQIKRYVERFEPTYYTDSGIAGTDAAGKSVWTGIDHLEGKSVAVRADGVYMGQFLVAGGAIELPRTARDVQIGLPFTNSITLLRPEIQAGDGSIQGNAQRVHEVSLLLMDTIGAKINGDEIAFREFGAELLDAAPQAFSGYERAGLTEWSRGDEKITISQDEPYPFHLLAVVRKITANS
ncbi:MAG TPA: hypothetical protein DCX52_14045 [Massilia sp.]|nr:hypothetical protein [Massilia sp.]